MFFGRTMKFQKPALTLDQQADLLLDRGMVGDHARMTERLCWVNYYRLSAYWHTFKAKDDQFLPDTTFDEVWRRYVFDRELRILVMDAVERVEVALRSRLAFAHAHVHGAFGYATNPDVLFKHDVGKRAEFLRRLKDDVARSHEPFVKHFYTKYGDVHEDLPIWVAAEVMSFGGLLSLYRGSGRDLQKGVAHEFGVADVVMESWLLHLNVVRNICAHHGRLWNREVGLKPKFPRRDDDWYVPVPVPNDRVFASLTILAYLLHRIAPGSGWADRFAALLAKNPTVPTAQMGMLNRWERCPIWARMLDQDQG